MLKGCLVQWQTAKPRPSLHIRADWSEPLMFTNAIWNEQAEKELQTIEPVRQHITLVKKGQINFRIDYVQCRVSEKSERLCEN